MFTRHQNHLAWLLLFAVVIVAGCGQDTTTSPLNLPPDTAPPSTPTGLAYLGQMDTKFSIGWTPCTDLDVAGYHVYRYDPDPSRPNAYVLVNQAPTVHSGMTIPGTPGTTYFFRVTSVDTSANESAMSDPITFTFDAVGSSLPSGDGSDHMIQSGKGTSSGPGRSGLPDQVGDSQDGRP